MLLQKKINLIFRFGEKLVIVASQKQRNEALLGRNFNPSYTWIDVTYCILERIGRYILYFALMRWIAPLFLLYKTHI